MEQEREIMCYYRERKSGGKGPLARALDYIALRAVFCAAICIWFFYKIPNTAAAAMLSIVTFILVLIACRLTRLLTLERFVRRERERLRHTILLEKLLFLPPARFQAVTAALHARRKDAAQAFAFGLQRSSPVGEDLLLHAYHRALLEKASTLVLYSTAPLCEKAAAMRRRLPIRTEFVPPEKLAAALSEHALLQVEDADIDAYILSCRSARIDARRNVKHALFSQNRAMKYMIAAGVLLLASFLTGYAVYYRLLACVCLLFGTISFLYSRQRAGSV